MTSRKEKDEEEGILEQMLRSLAAIGQNVERILDRVDLYSSGKNRRYDDEWTPDDLYDNGEY